VYGSACEWYEERRDATRVVDGDACKYFAERFSFFRHKAISPIDFSDRNVQFPDRRLRRESGAPPTVFSLGGRQLGGRDLRFPVARDQHAPTPRAVAHNRGARESESYGDAGRSGSVAMTFVATALGPRVRPAAVAAGPRGSAHGGTVGAIATAANRQRCLRRRAPGATIARLDARHTLGVGAGGAASRSRGCHLARRARVPPAGHRTRQPRYVPRPFRDNLDTRVPDTAQVPYLKKPQRGVCLHGGLLVSRIGTFLALFRLGAGRDLSRRFLRRREDPASPHSTDRPTAAALHPEPRADAFDPWETETGHSHASSGRPNFSGDAAAGDDDACKKACCGGSLFGSEDAPVDGSLDEEAFVSEAGIGSRRRVRGRRRRGRRRREDGRRRGGTQTRSKRR
jgi:hypothetical protein